ncbi:MAG: hypothetical protein RL679_786 [Bacteroidota bacterium]|jgi:hypothetical protein
MLNKAILLAASFYIVLIFTPNVNAQTDHWETVVYDNSVWKYIVPNASTSQNWIQPSFNADAWSSGQGGFGFGDGDDNTSIPSNSISVYHRISFTILDVSQITRAILNMDFDDGFVAYLNGVEIARNGIVSNGQPTYNQTASSSHEAALYQGNYPEQFEFSQSQFSGILLNGSNVLCIETHNQTIFSSDLSSRAFFSVGIANSSFNYGATPSWFVPPIEFTTSNLPIVLLNTEGVAIPDEPKIDGTMGIIDNGPGIVNNVNDSFNAFYGQIAIERRGSSSNSFPMKSYGIETRGPNPSLNYNASIFDWPADNDWILYAPYTDKTLIRNVLTFEIGTQMGHYAPRTKLCEVVLNGEYIGVYVFMERIKQNPGRVNVDELLPSDLTDNELTGGYIVKIDKTTAGGIIAWDSPFASANPGNSTISYQLHDPEITEMQPTQIQYIEDFITDWETALAGPNFANPISGYKAYIDEQSFIDFMLVNEISKNVDGYRISTFLHKNRLSEGGKLVAGPLWDFNLGWGNANYCQGGQTTGWEINFNTICGGGLDNPFWWNRLLEDPNYANAVKCRWLTLRETILSDAVLTNYIDSLAAVLTVPASRNYTKWPILGTYVWPNNFVGNTYQEEIGYLKSWMQSRLIWMDQNMFGTCDNLNLEENQKTASIVFPNPSDGKITIRPAMLLENVTLKLYTVEGILQYEQKFDQLKEENLDFSSLSKGYYLLTINQIDGIYQTIKIILR